MNDGALPPSAMSGPSKDRAALVAAYREGLGLGAIVVTRGAGGHSVAIAASAAGDQPEPATVVSARWWCRRTAEASRVAATAMAQMQRRESRDVHGLASGSLHRAGDAITAAATRLNVALYSDDEICSEAEKIIVRMNQEFERLTRAGELKAINRTYRDLRLQASARGEKVPSYAQWLSKYRADLVRRLAAALR